MVYTCVILTKPRLLFDADIDLPGTESTLIPLRVTGCLNMITSIPPV